MSPTFQTTPPARAVPLGRILRRELEARGWQCADLAEAMEVPEEVVEEIMAGSGEITEEIANKIGRALGMNPLFWKNLAAKCRPQDRASKESED